ncbi:TetR/AcrR family transcriptional regulator [Nocardioides sp. R-C-SC26]|uniref:TetR/AcrR family transcriptional regulator n=1 Tax=Nocardioides sp. R-C-SC26 TaxID=2870414 RepID=UPI001E584CDE|nr:TetR/AcrR family transcriptional regulator [Nocardioides sp. R-C-SC26]
MSSSAPSPSSQPAPETDGRRRAAAIRRRAREAEIIAATRALFDARGVRDAQIEDIARAVGINRAIVYRHFTGKEELFALTLVGYLDELRDALAAADGARTSPSDRLAAIVGAFVDYGVSHPAFVDCAQSLMRQSGPELLDEISESALFRLGRGISSCLSILSAALEDGVESGEFTPSADPTLMANTLYASGLGALQLARVGILVKEAAPGVPTVGEISPDQVRSYLVATALAVAGH